MKVLSRRFLEMSASQLVEAALPDFVEWRVGASGRAFLRDVRDAFVDVINRGIAPEAAVAPAIERAMDEWSSPGLRRMALIAFLGGAPRERLASLPPEGGMGVPDWQVSQVLGGVAHKLVSELLRRPVELSGRP